MAYLCKKYLPVSGVIFPSSMFFLTTASALEDMLGEANKVEDGGRKGTRAGQGHGDDIENGQECGFLLFLLC